jgi:MFS family permease
LTSQPKSKFFYGWVIVFAAWLATFSNGAATFTFGVFFPVLLDEFGWTRGMLSLGFSLSLIVGGAMGVVTGIVVDRIGPRRTVILGAVIGGIGISMLSQVSQIWHFFLFYGVIFAIGRSFSYFIASVTTVRRWFMKKAGAMVSIASSGPSLAAMILIPVGSRLIDIYSWQTCFILLGILLFVGAGTGGALLKKDPETIGAYPDGIKPTEEEIKARADFMARAERWGVTEAVRNRNFWFYILSLLGHYVAIFGLSVHLIQWGMDLDMSRDAVSDIMFWYRFATFSSAIIVGFLSDWVMSRFKGITRRPFLMLSTIGVGLGCFLGVSVVANSVQFSLIVILIGFFVGIGGSLHLTYLGDLFGVRNIPMLSGIRTPFYIGAGALGPILFGFSFDARNSYDLALTVTAILCVISLVALVLLRPPKKKRDNKTSEQI